MTGIPVIDSLLARPLFGNSAERWLIALAIVTLVVFALTLVKRRLLRRLQGLVSRTQNIVDDLLLDLVRHSRWLFFFVLGAYPGSLALQLSDAWDANLHRLYFIVFFSQADRN